MGRWSYSGMLLTRATYRSRVFAVDPVVARKTWRTLEPIHGIVYFAPEREEAFESLGLRSDQGGEAHGHPATEH